MLGARRREVAALAARERRAQARADAASVRLARAKARFLADPLNLLLPFTAGALGGALAFRRGPAKTRRGRRREHIAWAPLLKTATTLWGLSLPLREALLDARLAEASGAGADDPMTTPGARTASPPVHPTSVRPASARPPVARQPAPPA